MGDLAVRSINSEEVRREFLGYILRDIKALDQMIREDRFERGKRRIGAEQEMALVREDCFPSTAGPEILAAIEDPHYTTEIARFNLEANLDPFELRSDCLRATERQLRELLGLGESVAAGFGARVLLTGILPTITSFHLTRDHMTPRERYYLLSDVMKAQRGADFEIHIHGVDELMASLDTVLFEGCNTSFQMHLQVPPKEFVECYNWAQLISAPMLAVGANSPLLFGRELWMETRIALFQQSIDTRRKSNFLRDRQSRVYFGNRWLQESASELFKDHITRFPLLMSKTIEENPLAVLKAGGTPQLSALRLHNGTVYTWNRPCFGVGNGKAHLRIENRYIPSGPTVSDEMANFAFWVGLLLGQPEEYRGFYKKMSFRKPKDNFYRAARNGLHSVLCWFGRERMVSELILNDLLLIARNGLHKAGVNHSDVDHYLGIIEQRAESRQNGAQWQIDNFRRLHELHGAGVAARELTNGMLVRQESGDPVYNWPGIDADKVYAVGYHHDTVGQFMSTDLFVVREDESLGFVQAIMEWKSIRHLPVEDEEGLLIGLVTATNLKAFEKLPQDWEELPIREMMVRKLVTVSTDTPLKTAAKMMKTYGIGCLPVVHEGRLLGLITDTDVKRLKVET